MSTASALSSDVLHISTKFDDSVHEYQFARSHPQLFAQLQQLTATKYPLSPLYIHYIDEDGDMVRVTNEAELREAVRVCGSRLNLVLSSGLPSSSLSPAPQQPSIVSPTVLSHTPSPSPSLTSASPLQTSSFTAAASADAMDDIDDYLSSDEEELFEQARSQVRSQHSQQPALDIASEVDTEDEAEVKTPKSPGFGVVALDSEDEEDDDVRVEASTTEQPGAARVGAAALIDTQPVAEEQPTAPPTPKAKVDREVAEIDMFADLQIKSPVAEVYQGSAPAAVQPTQPASPEPQQPQADSMAQPAAVSDEKVDEKKDDDEDSVEAINARLRSFYQLDQQRQAAVSSSSATDSAALPTHYRSSSPIPVASLFTSFFAEPDVIATIRDNAALLTPLMTSSSFPVFLHHLCLLNPTLSSHPLTRYTFSVSSLHPFTVCAHCSASPVIGRLLYCRDCDVILCGACQQQGQHAADHQLAELALPEYRRDPSIAASPSVSMNVASPVRLDDGGRVLEERKASDFAELGDRMRASGQRVWKQGAVSLRKVDEMLTQFAADIKRMIESMLDGVFSDAPKPSPQQPSPQQQHSFDEQKQPVASPRSRQQNASGCAVRRPPCLPTSRPNTAPPANSRESAVPMAQPVRQNMPVAPQPPQPQPPSSSGFAYRTQLDVMGDMGLIRSGVEEETCKELLTASGGNIEQAVQWLMDKINV